MATPTQEGQGSSEMDTLAQFFRRSLGLQSITQSRLPKFRGLPQHAGDLTLSEWLEEFGEITACNKVVGEEKARLLMDHLTGSAREEIMCLDDKKRRDFDEIVNCLQLCFGFQETTQTLSCQFYNRLQRDGESLGDFSRMYNKMEKAAVTEDEGKALRQLRDKTICEQFVNGAQETWMRRELRRIQLEHEGEGFAVVRTEAVRLFQEAPSPRQRPRAREVEVDISRSTVHQPSSSKDNSNLLQEMVEQQKSILTELEQLRGEVTMLKQRRTQRRRAPPYITCFNCGQKGNYRRDCPHGNGNTSNGIPPQAENKWQWQRSEWQNNGNAPNGTPPQAENTWQWQHPEWQNNGNAPNGIPPQAEN